MRSLTRPAISSSVRRARRTWPRKRFQLSPTVPGPQGAPRFIPGAFTLADVHTEPWPFTKAVNRTMTREHTHTRTLRQTRRLPKMTHRSRTFSLFPIEFWVSGTSKETNSFHRDDRLQMLFTSRTSFRESSCTTWPFRDVVLSLF